MEASVSTDTSGNATNEENTISAIEGENVPAIGEMIEVSTEADDLRNIIEDPYISDVLFNHMSIADLYHLSNTSSTIEKIVNSHIIKKKKFDPFLKANVKKYILKNGNYRNFEPCVVRGATECILNGDNWRFYRIINDDQHSNQEEQHALIFKDKEAPSFKYSIQLFYLI